jgi:hypothetical protein
MHNNPLDSFMRRWLVSSHRVVNGVYLRGKFPEGPLADDTTFFFDLRNNRYIHFGDLLFFIPLILFLAERYPVACLATGTHRALLDFFLPADHHAVVLLEEPPAEFLLPQKAPTFIITTPYLLVKTRYPDTHTVVGLGLLSAPTRIPYPQFLAQAFLHFVRLPDWTPEQLSEITMKWIEGLRERINKAAVDEDSALPSCCIWLSPYLGSGRFRDLFRSKQRMLIATASGMSLRDGATILVAGSATDPPISWGDIPVQDMRGQDIVRMVRLAGSVKVIQGLGFDGFWMHLFDILEKRYDVLFRGRFTQMGRDLHYQSVNRSFLQGSNRKYL